MNLEIPDSEDVKKTFRNLLATIEIRDKEIEGLHEQVIGVHLELKAEKKTISQLKERVKSSEKKLVQLEDHAERSVAEVGQLREKTFSLSMATLMTVQESTPLAAEESIAEADKVVVEKEEEEGDEEGEEEEPPAPVVVSEPVLQSIQDRFITVEAFHEAVAALKSAFDRRLEQVSEELHQDLSRPKRKSSIVADLHDDAPPLVVLTTLDMETDENHEDSKETIDERIGVPPELVQCAVEAVAEPRVPAVPSTVGTLQMDESISVFAAEHSQSEENVSESASSVPAEGKRIDNTICMPREENTTTEMAVQTLEWMPMTSISAAAVEDSNQSQDATGGDSCYKYVDALVTAAEKSLRRLKVDVFKTPNASSTTANTEPSPSLSLQMSLRQLLLIERQSQRLLAAKAEVQSRLDSCETAMDALSDRQENDDIQDRVCAVRKGLHSFEKELASELLTMQMQTDDALRTIDITPILVAVESVDPLPLSTTMENHCSAAETQHTATVSSQTVSTSTEIEPIIVNEKDSDSVVAAYEQLTECIVKQGEVTSKIERETKDLQARVEATQKQMTAKHEELDLLLESILLKPEESHAHHVKKEHHTVKHQPFDVKEAWPFLAPLVTRLISDHSREQQRAIGLAPIPASLLTIRAMSDEDLEDISALEVAKDMSVLKAELHSLRVHLNHTKEMVRMLPTTSSSNLNVVHEASTSAPALSSFHRQSSLLRPAVHSPVEKQPPHVSDEKLSFSPIVPNKRTSVKDLNATHDVDYIRLEQEVLRLSTLLRDVTTEVRNNETVTKHLLFVTDEMTRERFTTAAKISESNRVIKRLTREAEEVHEKHASDIEQLNAKILALDRRFQGGEDSLGSLSISDDTSVAATKSLLCLTCGKATSMRREASSLSSPPEAHVTRSMSPFVLRPFTASTIDQKSSHTSKSADSVVSSIVRPVYLQPMRGQKSTKAEVTIMHRLHVMNFIH